MKRNSLVFIYILSFILVGFAFSTPNKKSHKIDSVLPKSHLRAFDPISIIFKHAIGPSNGSDCDNPKDFVTLTPDHPGQYRWLDSKTLQFLPTIPWPALEKIQLISGSTKHELITLMYPPKNIVPTSYSRNLKPFDSIVLTFENKIDLERLKRMISMEIKPNPGLKNIDGTAIGSTEFDIKEFERTSIQDDTKYEIRLHHKIQYGHTLILSLKLSNSPNIKANLARYTFQTLPPFTFSGIGSGQVVLPISQKGHHFSQDQALTIKHRSQPIILHFTNNLATIDLAAIKQMVHFEPSIDNFSFKIKGKKLYFNIIAPENQLIKMTLKHVDILDSDQRILNPFGSSSVYFFTPKPSPMIQWTLNQGISERYGPTKLPLKLKGEKQLDIRVYDINPLDENFWPFPAQVKVNEAKAPAGPGEEPNPGENIVEQIRQLPSPLVSKIINLPNSNSDQLFEMGLDIKPYIDLIAGKNQPGTYLVGYRPLGTSSIRHYARLQVTDLSLSIIEEENKVQFIVTSLKTALPLAEVQVVIEGTPSHGDKSNPIIFSGKTNHQGMVAYKHLESQPEIKKIWLKKNRDYLVLNPQTPPAEFHDNHWYRSWYTWLHWTAQSRRTSKKKSIHKAHIMTERPVYKPKDKVHIKGYIRDWREGQLSLNANQTYDLMISGPGNKSWRFDLDITKFGSFYHEFSKKDLPSGQYHATLRDKKYQNHLAQVSFRMENYRIPKFEISIDAPDKVGFDQPFELLLTADYYAGGRVVDQKVQWQVTKFPYIFKAANYPGFLFSTDEKFIQGKRLSGSNTIRQNSKTSALGSDSFSIDPTKEQTLGTDSIYH